MSEDGSVRLLPPNKSPRVERGLALVIVAAIFGFLAWTFALQRPGWPVWLLAAAALACGSVLNHWSPFTPHPHMRTALLFGLLAGPMAALLAFRPLVGKTAANGWAGAWGVAFFAGACLGYALRAHRAVLRTRPPR